MTLDEFAAISKSEFGFEVPKWYLGFLQAFPSELETTKLDLGWCHEPISERFILKAPEKIIEHNRDMRAADCRFLPDVEGWPRQYLIIGDDQCGNYYCIDASSGSQKIFFFDHDFETLKEIHPDMESFARDQLARTLEFNESKECEPSSPPNHRPFGTSGTSDAGASAPPEASGGR